MKSGQQAERAGGGDQQRHVGQRASSSIGINDELLRDDEPLPNSKRTCETAA